MQPPLANSNNNRASSLGFGLERIGIAALRHPYVATLLLLLSLAGSILAIPNVKFDGNIINVLNQKSKAFTNYKFQNEHFRNFAGDTWLIIKAPRLATAKGLEELRSLHLDLALEDNVTSVFSVFSLGDIEQGVDSFTPLVPDVIENDQQARNVLARILQEQPATSAILSSQESAIMMVVSLTVDGPISEQGLSAVLSNLKAITVELAPDDAEIMMSGYPAIRTSIVNAIINDQTLLTLTGIAIGAIVSLIVFGNLASAFICTIPPAIAVIWILATFSVTGARLNFLTTVLPTLALIISFADGIVIYFRWQALNKATSHDIANLEEAIWQVGPASSLTSITTALAFLSFAWASSATMGDFALYGMVAVMLAFLAVIVALPLACFWSEKMIRIGNGNRGPAFRAFGKFIASTVLVKPGWTVVASLILLAGFGLIHLQLQPSYTTSSHLPRNSDIKAAEAYSDMAFGGTSQYLIIVPVSEGGDFSSFENRMRVKQVNDIAVDMFGEDRTLSVHQIWQRTKPENIAKVAADLKSADAAMQGRLLADDRRSMMVVVQTNSRANTSLVNEDVARLDSAFSKLPFGKDIRITGLPVLLAAEFPPLIEQLRTGLLLAIILAVGVVGLAAGSFSLALATLVPNLLPILFAEAIIWSAGSNLDITNIIALTIAFGIAIDNAVHVINSFKSQSRVFKDPVIALKKSLAEISPALLASSFIVCVASVITQISPMPSINVLGRLLVLTLAMALITNLVVLPSYMLVLKKLGKPGLRKN